MNLFVLAREVLSSREATINWCRRHDLLPVQVTCPLCGSLAVYEDKGGFVAGRFVCRGTEKNHIIISQQTKSPLMEFSESGAKDTFFSKTKINLSQKLLLTYLWALDIKLDQIMHECYFIDEVEEDRISMRAISGWLLYLHKVAIRVIETIYLDTGKISRPTNIINSDEVKFGNWCEKIWRNECKKKYDGVFLGMINDISQINWSDFDFNE